MTKQELINLKSDMSYSEFYEEHKNLSVDALIGLLFMKRKSNLILHRNLDERTAVIDVVAEYLDIDKKGLYLYGVSADDHTPILDAIKQYFDKGGDKVQLKKRIAELENENAVLRSVIGK